MWKVGVFFHIFFFLGDLLNVVTGYRLVSSMKVY